MSDLTSLPSKRVSLNYLSSGCASGKEKPYRLFGIAPTADIPETNIILETYDVTIYDLRGYEEKLDLENDGFKLMRWPHTIKSTALSEEAMSYAEDMASRLQHDLQAERVIVIDYQAYHSPSGFSLGILTDAVPTQQSIDPADETRAVQTRR